MSTLGPAALCFYCHRPVDPVRDCWIGHGTMTHYRCAWVVDERFWAKLDMEEVSGSDKNRADERPT